MKKGFYLPNGNSQRGTWLSNLNAKLVPALVTLLGLSAADKSGLDADTQAFMYCLVLTEAAKTFEHQCVTYQLVLRNGPEAKAELVPVFSVLGDIPDAVAGGIFKRAAKLVKKIKNSSNYTETIGRALGIIGSEAEAKLTQDEVLPILAGKMVAGNVQIKYTRGVNDGIKLESRRGTETNFTLLEKINKPSYVDKRPNLVE